MKDFEALVQQAMAFDGMMTSSQIALFELLLGDQLKRGVQGDILECGVYKGRSASVLLEAVRDDEKVILIDASPHPDTKKLKEINTRFNLIRGKSEELIASDLLISTPGPYRFSHHDASHSYENVSRELAYMETVAGDDPIIVLDDFFSWAYPQVTAAAFAYLAEKSTDFEAFLVADNKAYLCRKGKFEYYARMLLDGVVDHMKSRGFDYCLARTDNGRFRAFGLSRKPKVGYPDRYGESIFGDRYYRL